jgi:hypothetical protein
MKTPSLPVRLWDCFDRWLCTTLYGPIRVCWAKLWVRKDEFHPSLSLHAEYAVGLTQEKREVYWNDLIRRRQIAHERDLDK